jgi:hypothetical protein
MARYPSIARACLHPVDDAGVLLLALCVTQVSNEVTVDIDRDDLVCSP